MLNLLDSLSHRVCFSLRSWTAGRKLIRLSKFDGYRTSLLLTILILLDPLLSVVSSFRDTIISWLRDTNRWLTHLAQTQLLDLRRITLILDIFSEMLVNKYPGTEDIELTDLTNV